MHWNIGLSRRDPRLIAARAGRLITPLVCAAVLIAGVIIFPAVAFAQNKPEMSPVEILNNFAKLGKYKLTPDIAYGRGPRHRLDVYAPAEPGKDLPVAVFFYGGSWQEGDRAMYRFVGAALAERGIVTIIPDYRVYPQVRFPDFLRDSAEAVRWARDHARDYGGDPQRIVLVGHSAGAYNAAMLALDPQWLAAVGLDSRRDIAGMVGLAGPYDFLPLKDKTLKTIFGPEAQLARTQPINFVDGREVPMLLAAGRLDRTVDPGNTTRLAKRIREKGGTVRDVLYAGADHRTIIGAFSPALRLLAPSFNDTVEFVKSR